MSTQAIYLYRKGKRRPDRDAALKLARASGLPIEAFIAEASVAREGARASTAPVPLQAPSRVLQFFEMAERDAAEDLSDEAPGVVLAELLPRTQAYIVCEYARKALDRGYYKGLFSAEVVDLERERREKQLVSRYRRRAAVSEKKGAKPAR